MVLVSQIVQRDTVQTALTIVSRVVGVPTLTMMLVLQRVQEDTDRL